MENLSSLPVKRKSSLLKNKSYKPNENCIDTSSVVITFQNLLTKPLKCGMCILDLIKNNYSDNAEEI